MAVVGGGNSIGEWLETLDLCGLSAAHSALRFPLYFEPRVESRYQSDFLYKTTYDGAQNGNYRFQRCMFMVLWEEIRYSLLLTSVRRISEQF